MKNKKQNSRLQINNYVKRSKRKSFKEKINVKNCRTTLKTVNPLDLLTEDVANVSSLQKVVSKFQNKGLRALDIIENSSDDQFAGTKSEYFINENGEHANKIKNVDKGGGDDCNELPVTHQDHQVIDDSCTLDLAHKTSEILNSSANIKTSIVTWPQLGRLQVEIPTNLQSYIQSNEGNIGNYDDLSELCDNNSNLSKEIGSSPLNHPEKSVNTKLLHNILKLKGLEENENFLTDFQSELFNIINNYQDLLFPQQTVENSSDIRFTYCLHLLNHVVKSNATVKSNNEKIAFASRNNSEISEERNSQDNNFLDQGLVRPKVLILLPFRSSAFNVVKIMADILYGEKSGFYKTNKTIENFNRFKEDYGGDDVPFHEARNKPSDYTKLFSGNVNDNFRFGICLKNKKLRLFSDFYSSDILMSSPLGLRSLIGAPGDPERDYDFLNSIEILILDQTDIFLAQNWDHILHIMNHLHLKPQKNRTEDYSRVRAWCLNGLSRYYRQTLLFASHELPEFRALYENNCSNYRGKVHVSNPILHGSIGNILIRIPQTFYRVNASNYQQSIDSRFNFFVTEILPKFRNFSSSHCMVYIPSYFDFVRLRNYFKSESIGFVQICEYSQKEKIARARNIFHHSGAPFLLYSERFHFFRRPRIKGIRHLIIYQPPTWPHLYADVVNLMQNCNQNPHDGLENNMDVTVLYTKYDLLRLCGIVGTDNALRLTRSRNSSHMFSQK